MTIPTKKLKNGFEMPVFGIGTYKMGEGGQDEKDLTAIKASIKFGVTHIDTAESYGQGKVEELVGEAIKDNDRSKLFIVSKVAKYNLTYNDVKSSVNLSLKRMGTSYLDLCLLHRYPGSDQLLKDCLRSLDELVGEGKIKNIGISNFNLEHTKQAKEWSPRPLVATQVHYNLQFREPEATGLVDYCQNNDIMLIAWRPVNKGMLTKSGTNLAKEGIPILDEMAKKYNKTPAQISINWLISQKNIITLSKSSSVDHLKENLGSVGWEMEKEDIERLRKEFPDQRDISDTVPLG